MRQPTGCLRCHSPLVRYGSAPTIYIGIGNGVFFSHEGTCAMCDKCGFTWNQYVSAANMLSTEQICERTKSQIVKDHCKKNDLPYIEVPLSNP